MSLLRKIFKKKGDGEAAGATDDHQQQRPAVVQGEAPAEDAAAEADDVVVDVSAIGALEDGVQLAEKEKDKEATTATAGASKKGKPRRDGGASLYRQLELDAKERAAARDQKPQTTVADPSLHIPIPGTAKAQEAVSSHSKAVRAGRLMKEYERIQKCSYVKEGIFSVTLADDNLFEWDLHYYRFDADCALTTDLAFMKREFGVDNVWFRISFPDTFPFAPPFIRVLAPLVQGGYVLHGGAICLELLTPQGWAQAFKMDAVIVQVVAAITQAGARIVPSVSHEFNETEARRAYDYLVKTHAKYGWKPEPKGEG